MRALLAFCCFVGLGLTVADCNYSSQGAYGQLWGVLGAGVFDTIKTSDSVEYYQVAPSMPGNGPQTYLPAGKALTLSGEQLSKLRVLILNDDSYVFGVLKKCVFVPETAFHFKKGDKEVTLLVSLNCKQVLYDLGAQRVRLDIDPSAERFSEFIQQLPH